MEQPFVTIIMPVHNEQDNLSRSIKSIIDQTFEHWVLFVIDDGSTDNSFKVISEFSDKDKRIIPFKNNVNKGITSSLNLGIEKCETKYIARMDADDFSHPQRIENQIKFMERNQEIDVLGSAARLVSLNGEIIGVNYRPEKHETIISKIHIYSPLIHPSIMTKSSFLKKWLYSEKYPFCEDFDLWLRAFPTSKFHNLQEVLIDYTVKNHTSVTRQITHYKCAINSKNLNFTQKIVVSLRAMAILSFMILKIYEPKLNSNERGKIVESK